MGCFSMPKGVPYPGEFKQMVVETMRNEKLGCVETAKRFGVAKQRVCDWERIYLTEGPEALHIDRRGRGTKGNSQDRPLKFDKKLEEDMDEVLKVVVMGRACRNAANIKNRQPIGNMFIKAPNALDDFYKAIIEEELNVKAVTFTDDVRDFTSYNFKPQLRTVGPKYGKQLGGIQKTLASLDGNAAMDELKANGALKFDVDGVEVALTEEDLLIEMSQKEGYVSEADNTVTVVLDTNLTEELIEEGFVLELISKIQTMRKDSEENLQVTDHIKVSVSGNDKIASLMENNKDAIAGKVLADAMTAGDNLKYAKEWNVNGENVTISIERA